jgi:hypothetical protein
MLATARLNAGLLMSADDEVIDAERLAAPDAVIEIEYPSRFDLEVWIAREDPTAVLLWPNGVGIQPPQNGGAANRHNQGRA